ncbi:MAG: pectin acetylesterase-family hydrolase [Eubacteriales bacterium]|nr:pectin acetylesterase-family hydrolase [Eubacteriales bacterium]
MNDLNNLNKKQQRAAKLGAFGERALDWKVNRDHAPILVGEPEKEIWYNVPIEEGKCGDGSAYHIYMRKGNSNKLCLFLSGGGVALNAYMAARPLTGPRMLAGLPNYHINNLRPATELMNIRAGLADTNYEQNPFREWNFLLVTYATGDFHIGDSELEYEDEETGSSCIHHFHGAANLRAAMERAKHWFPDPEQLLIAGDSAGGFAVPAVTPMILEQYYPDCRNVTVFSDSAQLLYRKWKHTVRDIWNADEPYWQGLDSYNITVDWYKALYEKYGSRLRYLYAASPRDFLLSSYMNNVVTHHYVTDAAVQEKYNMQVQRMITNLKRIIPEFGIFMYEFPNLRMGLGGTVHTCVRHEWFWLKNPMGITMAEWLLDAVNGNVYDSMNDVFYELLSENGLAYNEKKVDKK